MVNVTGIILAGGKSSRMGTDKGLVEYKGKSLVEYAIDLLSPFCDEVIIASDNEDYKQFGLTVVSDHYKDKGPLGGIHAGIKAAKNHWCLVLSCDMPHVLPLSVSYLLSNIQSENCIVPIHHGKVEPLFSVFSKSTLAHVEYCLKTDRLKMLRVLEELKAKFLCFNVITKQSVDHFHNVNRPKDLLSLPKIS